MHCACKLISSCLALDSKCAMVCYTCIQWNSLTMLFFILLQADLFSCEIDINGMNVLEDNYVFVGWRWYWDIAASSASESEQDYQESIRLTSDTTCTDSDGSRDRPKDTNLNPTSVIQTVVFKCIGATKEGPYQERLAEGNRLIRLGETVPVRLTPEPSNPFDAKLIAFECQVNGKWGRIGYIVKDILDEVMKHYLRRKL